MKQALNQLAKQICDMPKPKAISDNAWQDFASKTTVALMTGGQSSRFSSVPGSEGKNKNAVTLPNGKTMLEMTIEMYRDAGINNFVVLAFHNADSIEKALGDGTKLGVNLTYSYDPKIPVGKGGAVRNALDNGAIPENNHLIVHNPDDIIVGFPGSFPRYIARGHVANLTKGHQATVVVAPSHPYPFTGMKVVNNQIEEIEMYPDIPVPAHIGVTIFSPSVYPLFRKLFDLTKKSDFEAVLFPILAKDKQLGAVGLLEGKWIAVNDLKAYNQLCEALNTAP